MIFYLFFYLWTIQSQNRLRFIFLTITPIVLGLLIGLPQIAATKELSTLAWHARLGYTVLIQGSFPPTLIPLIISPFLFGGGYAKWPYWSLDSLVEMSGFITTFAFAIAVWVSLKKIFSKNSTHIQFWSIVGILSLFLALGGFTPLYHIPASLPIYNLFRIPARNLLLMNLAESALFAVGLEKLLSGNKKGEKSDNINEVIAALFCLAAFFNLAIALEPIYLARNLKLSMFEIQGMRLTFQYASPAFYIPFAFISAYALWLVLFKKFKTQPVMPILLTGLLFAETFSFGSISETNWPTIRDADAYSKSPIMEFQKNHAPLDRSAFFSNFTWPIFSTWPLFNIPEKNFMLTGYDPLITKKLQDMLNMLYVGASDDWENLLRNNLILSILNTRYIIIPKDSPLLKIINDIQGYPDFALTRTQKIALGKWSLHNAAKHEDIYRLQAPSPEEVSLILQNIKLMPKTHYELSFSAKASQEPTANLIVDFYGKSNNYMQYQFRIYPEQIQKGYTEFFKIIHFDSPESPQYIRVYTFSKNPIEIKKTEISKLSPYKVPLISAKPLNKATRLYDKVLETPTETVFENLNYLPRIFAVSELKSSDDLIEIKKMFYGLRVNPAKTAYVSDKNLSKIGAKIFSEGKIQDLNYDTDKISFSTSFKGDGFLVISDQYYPGWKAYADGKEISIYEADGLLRGIKIPSGDHRILLQYKPVKIYLCGIISLSLLIIALIFILFAKGNGVVNLNIRQ